MRCLWAMCLAHFLGTGASLCSGAAPLDLPSGVMFKAPAPSVLSAVPFNPDGIVDDGVIDDRE